MRQRSLVAVLATAAFVLDTVSSQTAPLHRRFEYKHSFRAPNLAQRDGSIPFWLITGDAIASSEQLRLAPSMRSRKGIAWNKRPMIESENFELEVAFKVTGQGRIGADGLAIWYTAQQGTVGPVFGANDYWTGMALMFDSFDNDGQRNNPYVSVMINDGTRSYDHQTDGAQQVLSGCQRDFRNKPFPVRVKVEYMNNVLTILITDGMTPQPRYELCLRAENIFLPRHGFFGVSAATGGLADDHDIVDFSVYSLTTAAERQQQQPALPQEERQKYEQEFEKQMHEFEEERKKSSIPEKAKDDDEYDPSKYYEDATQRELRQIYEAQTSIYKVLQQMEARLQQIQQQQTQHTSMLAQGGGAAAAPPQAGGAPPQAGATAGKNEVMQTLRDLTTSLRDMKNYVNEIFTRTYNMEQKLGGAQGTVQQVSGGGTAVQHDPQVMAALNEIRGHVQQIRTTQVNQGGPSAAAMGGCDNIPCVSSTIFLAVVIVQSGIILTFIFLRSKPDKAKFY
ncbi:Ile-1 protein [Aphelenchoides avenae]|nr:Ile-1 protein [Aphelenchus avenae]